MLQFRVNNTSQNKCFHSRGRTLTTTSPIHIFAEYMTSWVAETKQVFEKNIELGPDWSAPLHTPFLKERTAKLRKGWHIQICNFPSNGDQIPADSVTPGKGLPNGKFARHVFKALIGRSNFFSPSFEGVIFPTLKTRETKKQAERGELEIQKDRVIYLIFLFLVEVTNNAIRLCIVSIYKSKTSGVSFVKTCTFVIQMSLSSKLPAQLTYPRFTRWFSGTTASILAHKSVDIVTPHHLRTINVQDLYFVTPFKFMSHSFASRNN